jgi:aarF domain-containing kinase
MDELVKSVDALSREQAIYLLTQLGLESAMVPILIPGVKKSIFPLAPSLTEEDKLVVNNVTKILQFLTQGQSLTSFLLPSPADMAKRNSALAEVLPVLPELAREIIPELVSRLSSRIGARLIRDLYMS